MGERLSIWIHRGELREVTVEMLDALDIVDTYHRLNDLDHRMDESRRSMRDAWHRLVLASYPWLVIAPYGLLIAFKTRAAIRRRGLETAPALDRESDRTKAAIDPHTGEPAA
jgi:hypothetical protein